MHEIPLTIQLEKKINTETESKILLRCNKRQIPYSECKHQQHEQKKNCYLLPHTNSGANSTLCSLKKCLKTQSTNWIGL